MKRADYTSTGPAATAALRLHAGRTLIPLEFFGVLHGVKLDDALDLVDDFKLWPAFNLATSLEGRRKIHLWRGCVERYEPGRAMRRGKVMDVITAILPPLRNAPAASATVRGSELTFRFCCSHKRIADLVVAGELREVGHHSPVSQTARISYASVAEFLESRVLCRRPVMALNPPSADWEAVGMPSGQTQSNPVQVKNEA